MAWTNAKGGEPHISMTGHGEPAGLVAVTAPLAFVAPWAASVIGIVAGLLVCYGVYFFDHIAHVDDPCGAISVHGVAAHGACSPSASSPMEPTGTVGTASPGRSRGSSTAMAAS